jgi:phosphatidate cytidylyltransferase
MAFNFSIFKVRALSAVVFAIIMLVGIVWNNWSFFTLFAVIAMGCLFEYQKLLALIYPSYKNISVIHKWGLLLLGFSIMFALSHKILPIDAAIFNVVRTKGVPVLAGIILLSDILTKKFSFKNWIISLAGLIYIPMSLSLFYMIKGANANYNYDQYYAAYKFVIPLLIVVSIWVNDTMAYLVGSFIGRRPLSIVSPNKTWEGTIAGIIISVLLIPTVTHAIFTDLSTNFVFLLCLVSTIAGTYGDLFESSLKRQAGVKDSGNMMPGHGGFLDRFDSILLAVPFVWFLMDILYRQ